MLPHLEWKKANLCVLLFLYCRIIVGAPMGTFPGGLPLTDPGQSAENQTGLVYSCPVQPGVCEGVRGDTNITAQDIDANMQPNANTT